MVFWPYPPRLSSTIRAPGWLAGGSRFEGRANLDVVSGARAGPSSQRRVGPGRPCRWNAVRSGTAKKVRGPPGRQLCARQSGRGPARVVLAAWPTPPPGGAAEQGASRIVRAQRAPAPGRPRSWQFRHKGAYVVHRPERPSREGWRRPVFNAFNIEPALAGDGAAAAGSEHDLPSTRRNAAKPVGHRVACGGTRTGTGERGRPWHTERCSRGRRPALRRGRAGALGTPSPIAPCNLPTRRSAAKPVRHRVACDGTRTGTGERGRPWHTERCSRGLRPALRRGIAGALAGPYGLRPATSRPCAV